MRRRRVRLLAAVGLLPLALSLAVVVPAAAAAPAGPRHPVRDWNVSADGASSVTTASGGAGDGGGHAGRVCGSGRGRGRVANRDGQWVRANVASAGPGKRAGRVTRKPGRSLGRPRSSSCTVHAVLGHSGYQLSVTAADYMGAGAPSATVGYAASGRGGGDGQRHPVRVGAVAGRRRL